MKTTILGLVLAVGLTVPALGREIVVDLNGGAEFTEIQAAIDAAADGDTVLVKPGEYVITESINFKGKPITLTSENGPEATTIRQSATTVRVVVFESGETDATVLEGFSLRYSPDSSPALVGDDGGGDHHTQSGVYCMDSSPTLINCRISVQVPIGSAGGTGFYGTGHSSPSLVDCEISGNSGVGVIFDCTTRMCTGSTSSPKLIGCTISHNVGGGIYSNCGDSSISLTITDCAVSDNGRNGVSLGRFGCGALSLTNCTVAGNSGVGLEVGFWRKSATVKNSIIWGNHDGSIDESDSHELLVVYSCIGSTLSLVA